jgi:hypothetical protein
LRYYIPFRERKKTTPVITLNKNSKNINISDIGSLNTTIFIEGAYKDRQGELSPRPLMTLDYALIIDKKTREFIEKKKYEYNIEQACYIKNKDKYFEDYWIITPTIRESVVDLEKSIYHKDIIIEGIPPLDMYDFEEIVIREDKDVNAGIFKDPYLSEIVISEEFFNFIFDNRLTGLSFLEIRNYEEWKTTEPHKDHIIIEN